MMLIVKIITASRGCNYQTEINIMTVLFFKALLYNEKEQVHPNVFRAPGQTTANRPEYRLKHLQNKRKTNKLISFCHLKGPNRNRTTQ